MRLKKKFAKHPIDFESEMGCAKGVLNLMEEQSKRIEDEQTQIVGKIS